MPEVAAGCQRLCEQLRGYKERREKLPGEFNQFGYSVGHLLMELVMPAFLQDTAYLMNKNPDLQGAWGHLMECFSIRLSLSFYKKL